MITDRGDAAIGDDIDIVVHGGAGAVETIVEAALRNYHTYRGFRGLDGAFTVSTFAAVGGVTVDDICSVLPQRRYALAKLGAVRRTLGWVVLPTSDYDQDLTPEMLALQAVHFDLVIPISAPVPPGTRFDGSAELAELTAGVRSALTVETERFTRLFRPRRMKER